VVFFADTDGDGHGSPSSGTIIDCATPVGYASTGMDCNDDDASIYPGATEVCDSLDNDCDGSFDEDVSTTYWPDTDSDGYGESSTPIRACSPPAGTATIDGDCQDSVSTVYPGATDWHTATYEPVGGGESFDYDCSSTDDKRWPSTYTLASGAVYPAPCDPYFTEGWLGAPPACGETALYADSCMYTLAGGWELVVTVSYGYRIQECR